MPRAGLEYASIYEWRETAHWAGGGSVSYWEDFCDLDGDEQSAVVAHYQTQRQIEAVLAKDLEARRARAARQASRKRSGR